MKAADPPKDPMRTKNSTANFTTGPQAPTPRPVGNPHSRSLSPKGTGAKKGGY